MASAGRREWQNRRIGRPLLPGESPMKLFAAGTGELVGPTIAFAILSGKDDAEGLIQPAYRAQSG